MASLYKMPISSLNGIGAKRAELFNKLGVFSVGDLLNYYPRAYEDWSTVEKIKEGDIIALENGKLTITEKSTVKAVVKLAKNMVSKDTSFITLIYGEGVTEEDANKAYEELREKFGSKTDISLVKGDQPVYYFILSVE